MGIYKKKEKNLKSGEKELGDCYSLTAIKPKSRLFLSHREGGRTIEDAIALFTDIEAKRALNSAIPVFTTDEWDAFETALVQVYGTIEHPPYSGRGRPPKPIWVPYEELKYAQICKKRQNGRVVEVLQRVVFGDANEIRRLLGMGDNHCINTAYVERFNLTIRNCLARFVRKGMTFSKDPIIHTRAIDLFQAWYNLVKPHKSLRTSHHCGKRRWNPRTPMMAEGITDHIWTMKELLTFRIPVHL